MKQNSVLIPQIEVSFIPNNCVNTRSYVRSSREVYNVLMKIWNPNTIMLFEEFVVLYLDRRNGILGWRKIGQGNCAGVIVNIQLIFGIAVQSSCSSIILAHNHPSGSLIPSKQDTSITDKYGMVVNSLI